MATLEEREQVVRCDKCSRDGVVTISLFEGTDSRMVAISDGFSHRDDSVYCEFCRESVFSLPK